MTPLHPLPFSRRTMLAGLAASTLAGSLPGSVFAQGTPGSDPVTSHPRLWITAADLPRLRSSARADNPLWQEGMLPIADQFLAAMDDDTIPEGDPGGLYWTTYPTENAAQLFAYLSLVHPDEAARDDFGQRAHTLLMAAITAAARGVAEGEPFRDVNFSVFDRSRWWGAGFPLTVDWIHDRLTAEDKAAIRTVFLRWIAENSVAVVTGDYNHPKPEGVANDPALLADPVAVRWASNNYFTAHMRNIGLMALCFDAEDDPDGELTGALEQATGAWLYMVEAMLTVDCRGGLTAEGFEYTPLTLSYVTQFLLALHTAGQADPARWGPQVALASDRFWDDFLRASVHSLSPAPRIYPDLEYLGPIYQPAWYGDGEIYIAPDPITLLGPLGMIDARSGNEARLAIIRWFQTTMQSGGPDALLYRMSNGREDAHIAIFTFMLFEPGLPTQPDPRPDWPLDHVSAGIGRVLARTGWDEDATWFTYGLGWNMVDHQHGDGNQFEFYRNGEWLTKERTGYGYAIGGSDYHNTLSLENDPPDHNDPEDYRSDLWEHGSQWMIVAAGDPELIALDLQADYVYALGDATNLYNSTAELSEDIRHASRSIVWLKPDHIVIFDRAASRTARRYKRFWLNLPANGVVNGNLTTVGTPAGQQLIVTTLLPTDAAISTELAETEEVLASTIAVGETMTHRLRVEAPGGPNEARFLHVLQGADGGVAPDPVVLIESSDGTSFAGAWVARTAVLAPVELPLEFDFVTYTVPVGTRRHLITGLSPDGGYDIETGDAANGILVTIRPGSAMRANAAGVLDLATA